MRCQRRTAYKFPSSQGSLQHACVINRAGEGDPGTGHDSVEPLRRRDVAVVGPALFPSASEHISLTSFLCLCSSVKPCGRKPAKMQQKWFSHSRFWRPASKACNHVAFTHDFGTLN